MAITMAFLVLFSTLSFTVDMHYCGGSLVDLAILKKAEGCGMSMVFSDTMAEMHCCTDVELVQQGQDDLQTTFESLSFEQQLFVAAFTYSHMLLWEEITEDPILFKEYSPPLLTQDVQLLYQTFLI